ncbi:MAG TPA: UDP-N-acetylmuramoyl-tripeptide--D-alanyl-D-alanine ligase [Marmoricola sp.]|jgi:UDP-N-acetylmuramoyl-tripeptide--D-alanyl-D-alanine ligase|nr:UDP-N-acetylmuramoyl-tripeptide--D-alanyl-D-alanine ligase [Marmoricola sp.]
MITLSLAEIAEVAGGILADASDAGVLVSGPAFLDSREPLADGLFLAIAGEHVDGHDYAVGAVEGGAAAVLGSRPTGVPTVVVDDVEQALGTLAAYVLRRLRRTNPLLQVIAVTGSQGKTGVKDMLAAVLAGDAETVATYGSFNNELGLPITVLRAQESTRYLVLEMGARGIGHLAALTAIAPPDISVVLNVGRAHLGEFGSQENIAVAKGELVEALGPDGTAVLNLDDPLVAAMVPRTRGQIRTFGRTPGAFLQLSSVDVDDLGRPSFDLHTATERVRVRLRLLGEHQALNAAAAATAARAAGVALDRIGSGLEQITALSKWRMELHERADGLVVINDAYNANPDSMAAGLRALAGIGRRTGRPTLAVLGEMRELGETSAAEHAAIADLSVELGIDRVVVVGAGARAIYERRCESDDTATFYDAVHDAVDGVRNNVDGTQVVLVKASRAAGLERVAEALLAIDGEEAGL